MAEAGRCGWDERELERRGRRGQVAGEEQRPSDPTARSSAGSASRLLWRSEASTRRLTSPCPRRCDDSEDQPREPDELLVQLLRDRARGALGLLDRPQRDRDVGSVRVVLGVGDLAARRQQQHQCQAAGERGPDRGPEQPPQARSPAAPHGERDDQPGGQRAQEHEQEQLAQVRGQPVAGLGADRPDVGQVAPATRWAASRSTVRTSIDSASRKPDGREPRAPVHERDVEVEGALVEGLDGELDPAHAQVALRAVGREREQPPASAAMTTRATAAALRMVLTDHKLAPTRKGTTVEWRNGHPRHERPDHDAPDG